MASSPRQDWYFKDWLHALQLKQSQVVALTDWPKSKVSKLVNGKVDFDRQILQEAAFALDVHPYELLMTPEDAMALRGFRTAAFAIVAQERAAFDYRQPDQRTDDEDE